MQKYNFFREVSENSMAAASGALDLIDGLVCPQSPIQQRLHQIILDHKVS
jgi:hypothetical protein